MEMAKTEVKAERVAYCSGMDPKDYTTTRALFPDSTLVDYPNYQATYDAVVNGECDAVVFPFEKSNTGEVVQVVNMMYAGDLKVVDVVERDNDTNIVRYAVMARDGITVPGEGGTNKIMLTFTVVDEPGGLLRAISPLSTRGYNMSAIRSKHMPDLAWNYYFFVEAEGNGDAESGARMLDEMTASCATLKILGCYKG